MTAHTTMERPGMTYAGTGVNYEEMDPWKKKAQMAALQTRHNLKRFKNFSLIELEASRGESAYLIEAKGIKNACLLAQVIEGLGTKNIVTEKMYKLTGKSFFKEIAQDTVAMIVNDACTVGASPFSVAMHLAVGSSSWFNDETRSNDLIEGWRDACNKARCVWGPGETSTLKRIIYPNVFELSGSAMGILESYDRLLIGKIRHGDVMIFIGGTGIHANGLTLAREIGDRKKLGFWKKLLNFFFPNPNSSRNNPLPEGYLTKLPSGRTYGEVLLDPTPIYSPIVEDCLEAGLDIHAAINITGHGWRKLMRAYEPFAYIVETMPPLPEIFPFIQKYGPVDDREAYGNLNMGPGFALYVPEKAAVGVLKIIRNLGFKNADVAGHIENCDRKKVIIDPLGIEYSGDELAIRQ